MRNVAGCHLAGACPYEVLDITPVGRRPTTDLFLRNPIAQRLPRKFKINFSGCATDCGQAMFNDVGVIAVTRPLARRHASSPASRCSSPAASAPTRTRRRRSRSSRPARTCCPTIEAILRTFDHYGNRDNKLRARMKWLVDTMGIDELRERIFKERKFLHRVGDLPGRHPRRSSQERGDAPAGWRRHATVVGRRRRAGRAARGLDPFRPLGARPTSCAAAPTARSARTRTAALGDITDRAVPRRSPTIQRDFDARRPRSRTARTSCCATSREDAAARRSTTGSSSSTWPSPAPSSPATSSRCPGADTCNLAVTQSRGLAADIGRALDDAGLAEVGGVRINISGCTNSCGQHHISDIGFFGLERRAHGRAAPGYQMLLGGQRRRDGDRVRREGHEAAGQGRAARPSCGSSAASTASARRARRSPTWLARSGGAAGVGTTLKELDEFPDARRRPRLLRRLRRDRSVRRRRRRQRVRDMSTELTSSVPTDVAASRRRRCVDSTSRELAASLGRRSRRKPASAAIEWAWERFGDERRARGVVPGLRAHRPRVAGRTRDRGRVPRHAVPLRRDALVRRAGPASATTSTSRSWSPRVDPDDLWQTTPTSAARCARSSRSPRARGQGGVDDRPAARRGADPGDARRSSRSTSAAAS